MDQEWPYHYSTGGETLKIFACLTLGGAPRMRAGGSPAPVQPAVSLAVTHHLERGRDSPAPWL